VNFEAGYRSRFYDAFGDEGGGAFKADLTVSLPVTDNHKVNLG